MIYLLRNMGIVLFGAIIIYNAPIDPREDFARTFLSVFALAGAGYGIGALDMMFYLQRKEEEDAE